MKQMIETAFAKLSIRFLPWLLWCVCVVAILFAGKKESLLIWSVCFSYALFLLFFLKASKYFTESKFKFILTVIPFCIDLIFYGWLLYMHGGASNGGVSILYVPVVMSAVQLKRRAAWTIAIIAISIYTLLMMQGHGAHFNHLSQAFAQHLSGMWLTFVISTVLMTWFITQQRQAIIEQGKVIHHFKERQLRDEQILAVATTAANAAHTLATPLSTAGLLVGELAETAENVDQTVITDLSEQISVCQHAVHQIAQQARNLKPEPGVRTSAVEFIQSTLKYWWVSRNDIQYQLTIADSVHEQTLATDFNLQMSLTNILENAAYASQQNGNNTIEVTVKHQQGNLFIIIDDFGSGIDENLLSSLGHKVIGNKANGMGIGLVLANATIERLNGRLKLFNRDNGTRSQIELPCFDNDTK